MKNKMFLEDVNKKSRYYGSIKTYKKNIGLKITDRLGKKCDNITEVYYFIGLSYNNDTDFQDVYLAEFEMKNNGIIKYKDIVKVPYYSGLIDFEKNKVSNQTENYLKLIEDDKIDVSRLIIGYASECLIFKYENCSTYDVATRSSMGHRYFGLITYITKYLYNKNLLPPIIVKPLVKDIKYFVGNRMDLSLSKGNLKSKVIRKYLLWLMNMIDDLKDREWLTLADEIFALMVDYDYE